MPAEDHPVFEPGVEWEPVDIDIDLGGKSKVLWEPGERDGWVIDPLAYYIPFSTGRRNWGIKLIARKMLKDWQNLNTYTLKSGVYFPWSLYVSVITLHELGHHIVEECLIRLHKNYLDFSADPLNRKLEEGLCEYTAFALLGTEKARLDSWLFVHPRLFLRPRPDDIGTVVYGTIANYMEHHYGWGLPCTMEEECALSLTFLDTLFGKSFQRSNLSTINQAYVRSMKYWLSILYYWWNRSNQQNPYRPRIDPKIWDEVGPYYIELLIEHLKCREPSVISLRNYPWNILRIQYTPHLKSKNAELSRVIELSTLYDKKFFRLTNTIAWRSFPL